MVRKISPANRWAEPEQKPKSFIRESDESRVGFGARAHDIRHTEQQRHFAEKCTRQIARDDDLLIAMLSLRG